MLMRKGDESDGTCSDAKKLLFNVIPLNVEESHFILALRKMIDD